MFHEISAKVFFIVISAYKAVDRSSKWMYRATEILTGNVRLDNDSAVLDATIDALVVRMFGYYEHKDGYRILPSDDVTKARTEELQFALRLLGGLHDDELQVLAQERGNQGLL